MIAQRSDEKIMELQVKVIEARLDGMDRAITLQHNALEKRLEALNELRQAVVEDLEDFVRKDVYNDKVKVIDTDSNRITALETRSIVWTLVLGLILIGIQIFMKQR